MKKKHFSDRLFAEVEAKKSHVVVGLDPRPELMPLPVVEEACRGGGSNPASIARAIINFNGGVIDAVADIAVAVKCQIAFYERYGIEGLKAYSQTIRMAKESGLIVIGDVKRNDIGSTADAYALAHLGGNDGAAADFHVDALTVNPLFGADGVLPFVKRAAKNGCGVFILLSTSNATSGQVQELICNGRPLYSHLADLIGEWGGDYVGERGYSIAGAVVGATFPGRLESLRSMMPHTPFLIPGFGAQGGGVADVTAGFDRRGLGAVVNSSRGLIYAFRNEPYAGKYGEGAYKDAVRAATEDMRTGLWRCVRNRC